MRHGYLIWLKSEWKQTSVNYCHMVCYNTASLGYQTWRSQVRLGAALRGPDRISSEFTPLMAENWQGDMKLFIKTGSNLDILSTGKQRTLMKCFVSTGLWPQVEENSANSMEIMVHKVEEAYERQVPIFTRKVKFLELTRTKGELIKFCQGLHKADRLYDKIRDLEVKSWASAQETIKN